MIDENGRQWWESGAITAAIAALAAVIVGTGGVVVNYWTAAKTFDAKMVEIGVNILATDPGKTDVVPAREWAIGLVEDHSGRRFTDDDRAKLLHSPIAKCVIRDWNLTTDKAPQPWLFSLPCAP